MLINFSEMVIIFHSNHVPYSVFCDLHSSETITSPNVNSSKASLSHYFSTPTVPYGDPVRGERPQPHVSHKADLQPAGTEQRIGGEWFPK